MARTQYIDSSRSSRRRRNPPPAPEVDWARAEDERQDSPPRRSWTGANGDGNRTLRDWDYPRPGYRQDEEIIMRAPNSRASSPSLRQYLPEPRRRPSTASQSISSSRASMLVHRPPLSSMTRPSTSKEIYRRPSVALRASASAGYEDEDSPPGTRRSISRPRSVHLVPSAPISRHTSGTFASPLVSDPESDTEDTETTYDSEDDRQAREAETARLRNRTERSRSLAAPRRAHQSRRRKDEVPARPEEDYDETDSRNTHSIEEDPPVRARSRSLSRPRLRSRSRAPSARRIAYEPQDSGSDETSVDDLHDRFEPREDRKRRQKSQKREPRRRRSESYADPSPTPRRSSSKRYYDTEVVSVEKPGRHHPPSASLRRSNTVGGSQAAASQHHSKIWNKKFTEYSAKNRIYCTKRGCNEFIRPEDIHHADDGRKYGRCVRCRTKVCVRCNKKWHSARDCPKDEETLKFLAQAKDEGWQRCFRCKAMVELKEGCNHMTCRCGAEFCMICGSRWKSCECPWFNYDPAENDRLQHMQVPMPARDRFGVHPIDAPPSPPRDWAVSGATSFNGSRPRPQNYEEERLLRRLQDDRDEVYARRQQNYEDYEDDREDAFVGGFGEINGIGNAGGHHLNEDFRPRPRHIAVPQPPQPPPMPAMAIDPVGVFDRTGTGYIQDVNRARGVQTNPLDRRLADRFNSDLRQSSTHRAPGPHGPPLQSAATISLPAMGTALGPVAATPRRYTLEPGELFAEDSSRPRSGGTRSVERVTASGRTTRPVVYDEPEETVLPGAVVRKQHFRDPPKESLLAGLTGAGRGMDRVFEWRTHVEPGQIGPGPEMASVSSG